MPDLPVLYTPRLMLRILDDQAASAVADYYARNRVFHQPWFAARPDYLFTPSAQQKNLAAELDDFKSGRAIPFWLSLNEEPNRIIGRMAFTNIIRGCFHSCFMAYHLDQSCQRRGYAVEAGQAALTRLFTDFALHRVEASIMPRNARSIALAERLGFEREGLSHRYLQINDIWEDHLHYVKLSDGLVASPLPPTEISDGEIILRTVTGNDIPAAVDYMLRNRTYLTQWNAFPENLFDRAGWIDEIRRNQENVRKDIGVMLGLFLADRPDRLVGTVSCVNIRGLPFSCGEIGFSIDSLLAGRGLMLDALVLFVRHLFARYGLNRLTARVAGGNDRSLKLLSILGFDGEGIEHKSLFLHDTWVDCYLLTLFRDNFFSPG